MIGIYCIKNLTNGKRYIGQSGDILKRWKSHIRDLKNNSHNNRLLQLDFCEYGIEGFSFSILEEMEDRIKLNEREQYWINKFKTFNEYNQSVVLTNENKNNIRYMPVELLKGANVSLSRNTPDDYVSYITYEILIGLISECYTNNTTAIDLSINKVFKIRNLQRGKSTGESCKKYLYKLNYIRLYNENIINKFEYDPQYSNGNFVEFDSELISNCTFMPYNSSIFNSLCSAMSKQIYLIITFNNLKTSSKTFSIPKEDIYIFNDSDKYSYNKKVKSALNELVKNKIIKEYNIEENSIKITQ